MPRGIPRTQTEANPAAAPRATRATKSPADKAVEEYRSIESKLTAARQRKDDAVTVVTEASREITYREKLLAAAALNPDLPEGFDPAVKDAPRSVPQPDTRAGAPSVGVPDPTPPGEPDVAANPNEPQPQPAAAPQDDDPFAGLG